MTNNHNHNHNHNKTRVHRFYVRQTYKQAINDLQDILKREGSNLSKWICENAEHYVRLHEPGNPQQRLDMILQLGKAYHAPGPICGFKDCLRDGVGVGIFLPQKKPFHLCPFHLRQAREDPRNWNILTNGKGD